jgi:hypothetical protein
MNFSWKIYKNPCIPPSWISSSWNWYPVGLSSSYFKNYCSFLTNYYTLTLVEKSAFFIALIFLFKYRYLPVLTGIRYRSSRHYRYYRFWKSRYFYNLYFQWTHFLCCRYFFAKASESYEISIITFVSILEIMFLQKIDNMPKKLLQWNKPTKYWILKK